ncbi:MAG: phytanoyl-CoA dioxygenase family protein [bacterium]|nr:phytanoyl-CoA dioxygenase family protein [bacterium]
MAGLTAEQIEQFEAEGYLVAEGVLDPETILDPVIEEYSEVLDSLIHDLYQREEISSLFEGLDFAERFIKVCIETGDVHKQYFDFSLPFQNVKPDTPFWAGQAVLNAFTAESLLDCIESLIGPEIYSNPVQHVRIKPPEAILPKNQFGNPILGQTNWHQDQGVVVEEADETKMLTVWFAFQDVAIEQGPLKVVPRSHRDGLLTHCTNYHGNGPATVGGRQIPEKLFEADRTIPVPVKRGDVIFLTRRTVHGSLPNVSDTIRWSFDLRYNPIGQHTGRVAFPGFVARSRKHPEQELRDAKVWTQNWLNTREKMSKINQGGQIEVQFGRWKEGHPDCEV